MARTIKTRVSTRVLSPHCLVLSPVRFGALHPRTNGDPGVVAGWARRGERSGGIDVERDHGGMEWEWEGRRSHGKVSHSCRALMALDYSGLESRPGRVIEGGTIVAREPDSDYSVDRLQIIVVWDSDRASAASSLNARSSLYGCRSLSDSEEEAREKGRAVR